MFISICEDGQGDGIWTFGPRHGIEQRGGPVVRSDSGVSGGILLRAAAFGTIAGVLLKSIRVRRAGRLCGLWRGIVAGESRGIEGLWRLVNFLIRQSDFG